MPSHLSHFFFARDILNNGLGETGVQNIADYPELIAWGAQGPDLFYHNQVSRPSAFKYGRVLHRSGYGNLVRRMVDIRDTIDKDRERDKADIFILSFASHALLDRMMHPFIIYFAGWREPGERETYRFYRMHAFFERICDMLIGYEKGYLKDEIFTYSFYSVIGPVENSIDLIRSIVVPAVSLSYTDLNKPDLDDIRYMNTVRDALGFYRMTDPVQWDHLQAAYLRDKEGGFFRNRLALYYPRELPDSIDYLNKKRKVWKDPIHPEKSSSDSLLDIYDRAVDAGTVLVRDLYALIMKKNRSAGDNEKIERIVGDGNLSNGEAEKSPVPVVSDPLPLYDILARQYRYIEEEFGLDHAFMNKKTEKRPEDSF